MVLFGYLTLYMIINEVNKHLWKEMEGHKNNKQNGHQPVDCYDPVSKTLDIRFDGMYPSNVLSNLCSNGFRLDGVVCSSMEGFL